MKKIRFYSILILFFISLFLGCRNDLDRQLYKIEHDNISNITSSSKIYSEYAQEAPSESELNPIALKYYKNFEAAVYATKSNINTFSISSIGTHCRESKITKTTQIDNFLVNELKDIYIENEKGNKISFFDLKKQEQDTFLDRWIRYQAKNLGDKIQMAPELEEEIKLENQALEKTLNNKNCITKSSFLESYKNTLDILQYNNSNQIKAFFTSGNNIVDTVYFPKVLSILSQYAVRGNILVRLAKDGHPWTWLNLNNGSVGHVGIIFKKVPTNYEPNYIISIAAQKYGPNGGKIKKVVYEKINEWARTCYILEILEIKHHKNGKLKSIQPVSNQSAIADLAERYLGVRYVHKFEFPTANEVAPEGFTCSSLAWWCAKRAYKIDLSHNYFFQIGSQISISPEAVFRNNHTRIKAKIVD